MKSSRSVYVLFYKKQLDTPVDASETSEACREVYHSDNKKDRNEFMSAINKPLTSTVGDRVHDVGQESTTDNDSDGSFCIIPKPECDGSQTNLSNAKSDDHESFTHLKSGYDNAQRLDLDDVDQHQSLNCKEV